MTTNRTPTGIVYDRTGPPGATPVVLIHAGVADRRMWEPIWPRLTTGRDAIRLDLRGFGESTARPESLLNPAGDVLATLDHLGIGRCHLVAASYGAGVAVEVALGRSGAVASLVLAGPGGSLIPEDTPQLQSFDEAESAALAIGDVAAAVEANLAWWVDGPGQEPTRVANGTRELVAQMQRRAFELTLGWDDVEDHELDPPALERLAMITAPTLVLLGDLDVDAIRAAADRVVRDMPDARLVTWQDVAHLPSLERPEDFLDLVLGFLPD